MTRKQVAFIISVNAVISAAISVVVALLIVRPVEVVPTLAPTETAVEVATQAVMAVTPAQESVLHTVQAGDTISGLALLYDVPEENIIAANQLVNPDFLQVGMQLVIPVGGLAQSTATLTPAPTATDTPIPFEPPSANMTATAMAALGVTATALPKPPPPTGELQVEITEILGVGQADQETVVINNLGDRLADMLGWTLSDTNGNIYTFPNFRLWVGGSVMVHTRIGQDGNPPADLFWGKLEAVWSPGEVATLKDAAGATISTFVAGP